MEEHRKKYENKSVKKTLSIPAWLNTLAEKENVNFSQLLQSVLMEKLIIQSALMEKLNVSIIFENVLKKFKH